MPPCCSTPQNTDKMLSINAYNRKREGSISNEKDVASEFPKTRNSPDITELVVQVP